MNWKSGKADSGNRLLSLWYAVKIPKLMNQLQESEIYCPYCGEMITILVDESQEDQQYIEDCQVCCRPINIRVSAGFDGGWQVEATDENS